MKTRFNVANTAHAIIACVLWSTAFVGVKYGLQFARPLFFAGSRFMLSGLLLLPLCGSMVAYYNMVKKHFRYILVVSLFQTFLLYTCFYVGMTFVPGALAAIVIGSSPMFTALVVHFMLPDESMTASKGLSIGIGMVGIVVISISRQPWVSYGLQEFIGVIILIGGCISSAIGNVLVAKDKSQINPVVLNSFQIFLGGSMLFLLSLGFEGVPGVVYPVQFYGVLLYLALLSAIAFSIWFVLLKKPEVQVSELNLWKFIIPVLGAALSWSFLKEESPELFSVIGMVCVVMSILSYNIITLRRK